jgi:hypothetical protein
VACAKGKSACKGRVVVRTRRKATIGQRSFSLKPGKKQTVLIALKSRQQDARQLSVLAYLGAGKSPVATIPVRS